LHFITAENSVLVRLFSEDQPKQNLQIHVLQTSTIKYISNSTEQCHFSEADSHSTSQEIPPAPSYGTPSIISVFRTTYN